MYKNKNIIQHHKNKLQQIKQFLASKDVIPNPILRNNDTVKEDEQEDDDSMWEEMIKVAQRAKENKNRQEQYENEGKGHERENKNQNGRKTEMNNENNLENVNNFNNIMDLQRFLQDDDEQQSQIQTYNYPQSNNTYMQKNFTPRTNSFDNNSCGGSESSENYETYKSGMNSKHEPKKKKEKKTKAIKQQQNSNIFQNIIKQKNQNLFTIDKLKVEQPLTRNYRIGDKEQWQNNKRIEDYKLQYALRKFPKIKDFRNNQKAIIKCSLLGNDVFVCMPTGGGKSLTFQAMSFIQKGIYLVILPLVSLIIDQQMQAQKVGIKAYSLTGQKQQQDNKQIYNQISSYEPGEDSIVIFCTPEKINKSMAFFKVLERAYDKRTLIKIVIDEVHCVSTWGQQFRQDYLILSSLRQNFPNTPILGLTATVTEIVKQDIIKILGITNCYYFESSFNRPNLYYEVRDKNKDVLNNIIRIISEYQDQSGIIYCLSRKDCEDMCKELKNRRYKVAFYHAQIRENQKKEIQGKWMQNQIQIIIATIAFGMGINKPDVRFVIHHSLSKSIQNYYQESGRAGRDGQNAKCILFYRKSDKLSFQTLIMKNEISNDENKNFCMKQLSGMIKYCEDKYTCRRKLQLDYLGEKNFSPVDCNKTCDNCKRGWQCVEVQCIKQAKLLIQFVIAMDQIRQNISQNQIIMICKGMNDKKFRYKLDQIERGVDLTQLREIFTKWTKQHIDQLLTELLSHEIFYEKLFTINTFKKNNMVSNFYIKVNYPIAHKFLQKVQTLPMKRYINPKKVKEKQSINTTDFEDYEFDFEELTKIEEGTEDQHAGSTQFEESRYLFDGNKKSIEPSY